MISTQLGRRLLNGQVTTNREQADHKLAFGIEGVVNSDDKELDEGRRFGSFLGHSNQRHCLCRNHHCNEVERVF